MDTVVLVRTVRCFTNNKQWVNSKVKAVLNRNKRALRRKDKEEMRKVQEELRLCLRGAKEKYRMKLERKLRQNNMRVVWDGGEHEESL